MNACADFLEVPPAWLDDIPEPDAAYYEQISGGFDDSIYSEPVIIEPETKTEIISVLPRAHTPTRPQNQAVYRLDVFDILSRARVEISAIAADAFIDWQKLEPQINKAQRQYKKNIALTKEANNKTMAFVDFKTTRGGQEYPFITFFTQKHGGESFVFDGYQWLKDSGLVNAKPLSESELKALAAKRAERDHQQAKRAELAAKKQAFENIQKTTRFNQFTAIFNALPKLSPAEFNSTYLAAKGFKFEQLPAEFIIKRGFDNRGGFIVYALKNATQQTTGYQKIYDLPFTDNGGNTRNKDFIFLPSAKNGSYATLSHAKKINKTEKIFIA